MTKLISLPQLMVFCVLAFEAQHHQQQYRLNYIY